MEDPDPPWKTRKLGNVSGAGGGRGGDVQRLLMADLLLGVELVLLEELGVEADVSGLVHAVYVAEGGGDGKVGADLGEGGVDVEDVLGLGIELAVVDAGVVYAVLLAAGDADLHLEPEADGGHAGKVLCAGGDVLLLGLFGEVEHVGGEEGLAVLLEVGLVGGEHAVEPGEELVGAVVGVHDDGPGDRDQQARSERWG